MNDAFFYPLNTSMIESKTVEIPQYMSKSIDAETYIYQLGATGEHDKYIIPESSSNQMRFLRSYIPSIIGIISIRGIDMYEALELGKGTMRAYIQKRLYLVTLIDDEFSNSSEIYYPAGIAAI